MLARRTAGGLALSVVLLAGCGGGGGPEGAVEDLAAAVADGDAEGICANLTEEAIEEEGGCEEATTVGDDERENAGRIADVEVVEESDGEAVVEVAIEGDEEEVPNTITVVNVDGEWKATGIDFD